MLTSTAVPSRVSLAEKPVRDRYAKVPGAKLTLRPKDGATVLVGSSATEEEKAICQQFLANGGQYVQQCLTSLPYSELRARLQSIMDAVDEYVTPFLGKDLCIDYVQALQPTNPNIPTLCVGWIQVRGSDLPFFLFVQRRCDRFPQ